MVQRKAEFLVKGNPDVVLDILRCFFESDEWSRTPSDPVKKRNKVTALVEKPSMPKTLLWLVGYGKRVKVSAVRDEPGWTKLRVKARNPIHTQTLAAWIQKELIRNEAAACVGAP